MILCEIICLCILYMYKTLIYLQVIVLVQNHKWLQLYYTQHTQPFYGFLDSVWNNPGEPVPEETFTHLHLSWSLVIPYLLPPSIMLNGILPVQFTCLTVFFHNLQVFFGLPGTLHFILHTFLHPIIVSFHSTYAYHRNLFCCSTEIFI